MLLIEDLIHDLKTYAIERNNGMICKEEFNLNIDLLIERVKRIEINFEDTKIVNHHNTFNQLLFKAKFKAIESFQQLQKENHKRSINGRIRKMIAAKLYFKSIHRTLTKNIHAYRRQVVINSLDIHILIESEVNEDGPKLLKQIT